MVLVTERFTSLAEASMKGKGAPDAPLVVLPRTELTEYVAPEIVRSVAREIVQSVVSRWLSREPA